LKNSKTTKDTKNQIIKIIPKGENISTIYPVLGIYSKNFLSKFKDVLTKELFVDANAKILIAVSGGIDSVALLDAFACAKIIFSFHLAVAHLNHKLRGEEADQDEAFVQMLAEKYGVPFLLQRIDVKELASKHSLTIEEAARKARYDFLRRAGQSFAANFIATAHNLNDQAETVLLNIIRGTGIAGLRGIAKKMEIQKNIFLIRPFLAFSRTEIEQYAIERQLQWREDSSNVLLEYTRNRIRHKLIPLLESEFNPQIVGNLAKLSQIAQNSFKIVSNYLRKFVDNVVTVKNKNEVIFDLESFKLYDSSIFPDIIQFIASNYFQYTLNYNQIDEIRKLTNADTGKYFKISKEIFVFKNRQKLCFIKKEKVKSEKLVVRLQKVGHIVWRNYFIEFEEVRKEDFQMLDDPTVEFFDYEKIGEEILVRTWKEGDRFVPLGMKKAKKLSDFLIDEKVPLYKKENLPIFVTNNEIFWVGGIRISDKFKVTKNTKRILKGKITEIS
jgi:tRNA(Ile)-lysidine synthase